MSSSRILKGVPLSGKQWLSCSRFDAPSEALAPPMTERNPPVTIAEGGAMSTPRELHQRVRAGRLELRNRIVMPAHTTNFAVDGGFSQRHLAYHRARAAGGVGLIVTEGMRVHATSLGRTNTVSAGDGRTIGALGELGAPGH